MWSVQPVHVSHCFPLPQFAWLCLITCLDLSSHHQSSVLKKAEIPQIHATALCRRREGVCKHVQTCANMITRGSLSSLWLLLMLLWTNVDCGWQCLMSRWPTTINNPYLHLGLGFELRPSAAVDNCVALSFDTGHLTMDTVHTRPESPQSHCEQRLSAHYSLLGSLLSDSPETL